VLSLLDSFEAAPQRWVMDVKQACETLWDCYQGDCSGFVRAVAEAVGVMLQGDANAIADTLRAGKDGWEKLADGCAAAAAAQDRLVIGGLRGDHQATPDPHGHVVVVVEGPLNRGRYPTAWWGSLAGTPAKNDTINYAWVERDRDTVVYAAHALPAGTGPS
jgi:hypothetical protein